MKNKFTNQDGLDLLAEIKNNTVDLILTDPPYVISRDSGMNTFFNAKDEFGNPITDKKWGNRYKIKTDYGDWDSKFTIETLIQFIEEYYRILRAGGTCIIFFDLWKIESLKNILEKINFKKIRFIEWIKTNPVPINSKIAYLSNSREVALFCTKGAKNTFNSKYDNGIYNFPIYQGKRGIDRIHPTQKSLLLFEELIKKHTNEGDLVVDTFGGSATTYIASITQNRFCLSSEIDKNFYDKSIKRIIKYDKINKKKKTPF